MSINLNTSKETLEKRLRYVLFEANYKAVDNEHFGCPEGIGCPGTDPDDYEDKANECVECWMRWLEEHVI